MGRQTYKQDPDTKKYIPKAEWEAKFGSGAKQAGFYVQADVEPFKSPIDGSIIGTRHQLTEHNKRHGVTNTRDYKDGYVEKRAAARNDEYHGRTASAKKERIGAIQRSMARLEHGYKD